MAERNTEHSIPIRPSRLAVLFDDGYYRSKDRRRSALLPYLARLAMILACAVVLYAAVQAMRSAAYERGAAESELKAVQLTRLQQQQYFNWGRTQGYQEGYKAALTGGLEKGVKR